VPGIPHIPEDALPLAVERFFTLPQCDLEDEHGVPHTPIVWLVAGHSVEAVIALARDV
jgi:hypothetical protein